MAEDKDLDKELDNIEQKESEIEDLNSIDNTESADLDEKIPQDDVAQTVSDISGDEQALTSDSASGNDIEATDVKNDELQSVSEVIEEGIDSNQDIKQEAGPIIDNDINDDETEDMITVRPVKFQEFELNEPNRSLKKNLDILQDVSLHVSVELGRARFTIKEVMDLEKGSIVELDKIAGEQVEIYVNNKMVAKGEVIVIEDKFGVRVTSTNIPKKY